MILRIDDIDHTRCREEFVPPILENLAWLGLNWFSVNPNAVTKSDMTLQNVSRQSHRKTQYQAALKALDNLGLIYPCYLSRRELDGAIKRATYFAITSRTNRSAVPASGNQYGPTFKCSRAGAASDRRKRASLAVTHECSVGKGATDGSKTLSWFDHITGHQVAKPEEFGDVVIARADISVSYHLSVVVDDALDGINLVTRGNDLAQFTHLHRLLQVFARITCTGILPSCSCSRCHWQTACQARFCS